MGYEIPVDHHGGLPTPTPASKPSAPEHPGNTMAIDFAELARSIHAANVATGWWSDLATGESIIATRNRGEMMMLVVSELSEAATGLLSGAMDDKLPHWPMYDVELADTAIRLFDLIGAETDSPPFFDAPIGLAEARRSLGVNSGTLPYLMKIVNRVSAAMEHHRKGRTGLYVEELVGTLYALFVLADIGGVPLLQIIDEKRAFNASRADHKIENRRKVGGKAY